MAAKKNPCTVIHDVPTKPFGAVTSTRFKEHVMMIAAKIVVVNISVKNRVQYTALVGLSFCNKKDKFDGGRGWCDALDRMGDKNFVLPVVGFVGEDIIDVTIDALKTLAKARDPKLRKIEVPDKVITHLRRM